MQEQPASDTVAQGQASGGANGSAGSKQQLASSPAPSAAGPAGLAVEALPDAVQVLLRQSVAFMEEQSSVGSESLVSLGCAVARCLLVQQMRQASQGFARAWTAPLLPLCRCRSPA